MKRSAATAVARPRVRLRLVGSVAPANDNRDRELDAIDQEWLRLHARLLRGRSMRLTVRYVGELITEERVLAFTGCRVEVWRCEVSEPVESVQTFLLRIR